MTPPKRQLIADAAAGRCPRCGAKGLFRSFIAFASKCPGCGLDYDSFNVGDGGASFLIFIVGAIVVVGAIWLELSQSPPFWLHILLWVPLTLVLTVLLLRIAKGMLLALEYHNAAGEGRLQS